MFRAFLALCFVFAMQISSAHGSGDSNGIPGTVNVDNTLDDHAGAAAALAAALANCSGRKRRGYKSAVPTSDSIETAVEQEVPNTPGS